MYTLIEIHFYNNMRNFNLKILFFYSTILRIYTYICRRNKKKISFDKRSRNRTGL